MQIRLVLFIFLSITFVNAQTTIQITDFGGVPNNRVNVIPAIRNALQYASQNGNVILSFPKGRYDFWPTELNGKPNNTGFDLFKLKGITIDGNNSEFIFHDKMKIAHVDSCLDIKFQNFTVDWERPFISQAEVVETTDSTVEIFIDREKYPYQIENKKLVFVGEGWRLPVIIGFNNAYDRVQKEIVYNTWESPLGHIFNEDVIEKANGNILIKAKPKFQLEKGTYVSLFHLKYAIIGFEFHNSKDLVMRNLQIHHALSHGVYGQRCENITMTNTSMAVNDSKGRVFSTIADASHFKNCKGLIKIDNCAHTGQGDDFINIHGMNVQIDQILNENTLILGKHGEVMRENDELWFINKETNLRIDSRTVKTFRVVDRAKRLYQVSFNEKLPENMKIGDFVENKTWNPTVEIRNCKILKRNRARGILVTTPNDVIIENNFFRTAGTAILIEGDFNQWYESGANNNMKIRNNIFEDCLTSGNKNGSRWEWGDAVITISPSHKPTDNKTVPYHNNIFIENNVFKVFDAPLLRARSVNRLDFNNNEIIKTTSYQPYSWQKSAFLLDGCRNVQIKNNKIDDKYKTRNILIEHMKKSEITLDKNQKFKIDFVKDFTTYLVN